MRVRVNVGGGSGRSKALFERNSGDRALAESLEPRFCLSGQLAASFDGLPAMFVPNRGQWDPSIRYAAHGTGADILFTDTGPTFRISHRQGPARTAGTEWSMRFVDASGVTPTGAEPQAATLNYYVGERSQWRSGVSTYGGVTYENVWDGIDARVMARDNGMKYEFHVEPGADPRSIAMRYDGIEALKVNRDGSLSIRTAAGTVSDDAPIAWQTRPEGTRLPVDAEFVLLDRFTYTIAPTHGYDPSLPLVLDPQLAFATYLGGNGVDAANAIVADGAGGAWVTGITTGLNFPVPGGFDTAFGGSFDAFVSRITAAGTLAYGTFIGGGSVEEGNAITTDGAGGVWVTGRTQSTNFPTLNAFDTELGQVSDAFIVRITSAGTLASASYLGGAEDEEIGNGLAPDGAGGVWVTGQTDSNDFPTPNGFDTTQAVGNDIFIARVTSDGTLVFGSYIGGSNSDTGLAAASDGAGGVWLTSVTSSTGLPTPGGFDATHNSSQDAYVARVTAAGTLAFGSYMGGSNSDNGTGLIPDGTGGVWMTGTTSSNNFPTPNGFDTTHNTSQDAFIARISAGGAHTFGSYLGGTSPDYGAAIASDGAGGAWITGRTSSPDFPVPGGFDTTVGTLSDAFVARIASGGTLAFASYLGGNGFEYSNGIAPDGAGGAWVTGETDSIDFPTPGGFDTGLNSDDAWVARISAGGDTTPPTVAASLLAFDASPQSFRITFNENVSASLSVADLTLENLTSGQTVSSMNITLSYDSLTNVATFRFPGMPGGFLPDGNYRATLPAGSVADASGNPLAASAVSTFFVLAADPNRDRSVNIDDFGLLAARFNLPGTFSQGDFNYTGTADIDDFGLLAARFNSALPPAASVPATSGLGLMSVESLDARSAATAAAPRAGAGSWPTVQADSLWRRGLFAAQSLVEVDVVASGDDRRTYFASPS